MKHYQMYIDGEWVDAADGARLESINPASGEVWATAAVAGEAEVNRAVAAAKAAFPAWSALSANERAEQMRAALVGIAEARDDDQVEDDLGEGEQRVAEGDHQQRGDCLDLDDLEDAGARRGHQANSVNTFQKPTSKCTA